MELRQDIQILRGLAVTFVVLFHLQITGISSGFLGVDIFFVVSGFLMAILYKDGKPKQFFERRARRLLPAYFTTVIFTLIISFFIVLPSESSQVIKQSLYSMFFENNFGFWMQNSYFSKSDFNPLLHLWSLGVEIQFYLIVPLLVWFFRKSKILLPLCLLASFSACIFFLGISPKTSFFMMPFRIWEFLIGFIVAYYFSINGSIKYKKYNYIGLISLLFLFATPFLHIDGESLNRIFGHPGFYALFACVFTAITIAFGLPKYITNSVLGRILEKLGNYSYSIYLVHFPIIVLYLYEPFSGTNLHPKSGLDIIIILLLITIMSVIMHNFIEKKNVKNIFKLYATSFISLLILTGATKISPKIIYSDYEQNIFNGLNDRASYRCGKLFRITHPKDLSCKLNKKTFNNSVLLVGNSHADAIKQEFSRIAEKNNFNTYFLASNTPLMDSQITPEMVVNEAKKYNIKHIVLHYAYNTLAASKIIEVSNLAKEQGIKISYISPVPVYNDMVPKIIFESGKTTMNNKNDFIKDNHQFITELSLYSSTNSLFDLYSVEKVMCPSSCLIADTKGHPYYFDTNHLTLTGARLLTPVFEEIFKNNSKEL